MGIPNRVADNHELHRRATIRCIWASIGVLLALETGCPDDPRDRYLRSAKPSATDGSDLEEPPEHTGLPRLIEPERSYAAVAIRPRASGRRCDSRGRFCVHAVTGTTLDDAESSAILGVANDALDTFLSLKLPRPLPDVDLGGDDSIDLYVDATSAAPAAFIDPGSASHGIDQAPAFIVLPKLGPGCHHRFGLAAAVGKAVLLGLDAALESNSLAMLGDYLGTLAQPCTLAELEAVDSSMRAPERTFTGELGASDPAAFLFPKFLEERYGAGERGDLTVALAAIAGQRTPRGSALVDEPDMFDALRVTQQRNKSSLGDTLLEFAVWRAFMGSRSDDAHLIDVTKYGALGRARIEWDVAYTSLPRYLAPLRPIEALGATYLWVDLTGATAESELTMVVDWEPPVAFRWAIVKLDGEGAETGRKELFGVLGSTHIETTLRDLREAKSLLIVGVNEGIARRDQPFDPGRLREAPRSYSIQLAQ